MEAQKCPNCGADLAYDKSKFAYVCKFCGHEFVSEESHRLEMYAEENRRLSGELEDEIREEEAAANLIDNLETKIYAVERLRKISRVLFGFFLALALMPLVFFVCGMCSVGNAELEELFSNICTGFVFGEILSLPATVTFGVIALKCKSKLAKLRADLALVHEIHEM